MDIVIAIVAGVIGVLVGGVINALSDDLPARRRPRIPHYPNGTPRPMPVWLGLAAFLTGQRAAPDDPDAKLSWRHPIVELATGLGFAGIVLGFGDEQNMLAWLVYVAIMMLITVIDVEHRLILFMVIVPSCVFALFVAVVSPEEGKTLSEYTFGGAAGFGVFFVMFVGGILFMVATRREGVAFGFGDVMLATLSGLILGWKAFIVAVWITVFAGAAGALLYLVGRLLLRRRYQWFTPLPYGPYIVIGTLSVLLFGDQLRDLLWNVS